MVPDCVSDGPAGSALRPPPVLWASTGILAVRPAFVCFRMRPPFVCSRTRTSFLAYRWVQRCSPSNRLAVLRASSPTSRVAPAIIPPIRLCGTVMETASSASPAAAVRRREPPRLDRHLPRPCADRIATAHGCRPVVDGRQVQLAAELPAHPPQPVARAVGAAEQVGHALVARFSVSVSSLLSTRSLLSAVRFRAPRRCRDSPMEASVGTRSRRAPGLDGGPKGRFAWYQNARPSVTVSGSRRRL